MVDVRTRPSSLISGFVLTGVLLALVTGGASDAFADRKTAKSFSRAMVLQPGASKSIHVPKNLRGQAAVAGALHLLIAGQGAGELSVVTKNGKSATNLRASARSSTWIVEYDNSKTLQLTNEGDEPAKVFLVLSARRNPKPTPTGSPAATATKKPNPGNPTATPTPSSEPTNTPTPVATNTPTTAPTSTPTATPTGTQIPGDDLPPGVGHKRTCADIKKIVPDRILYVSTSGLDSNPGTAALPWRTLQKACDSVQPGDAVYVKAGTYKGCTIYSPISGTEAKPISIQAAPLGATGYEAVTIDGKSSATFATHGVLNSEGASYTVFRGFTVAGNDARTGIRIVSGKGQAVCENTIINSQIWGVLGGFTEEALVEDNDIFRPAQQHGIYFGEADDRYVIRRNYIEQPNQICMHNNGSGAMNTGALIELNICYKAAVNGGAQLNMDGVENSVVRNNIFYGGSRNGIALFHQDGAFASRNNWIIGNTFHFTGNTGYYAIAVNEGAVGNKLFNNILYRTPNGFRGSLAVDPSALANFESDYNVFPGSGVGAVNFDDSVEESAPISLAEWQAKGYDTHSKVASESALFVNAAAGDFTLKAGSPAQQAGVSKPEYLLRDFMGTLRGNPPSIGAFE